MKFLIILTLIPISCMFASVALATVLPPLEAYMCTVLYGFFLGSSLGYLGARGNKNV